ncbi:RluA family pseudouridine synthase [Blastopirellula sp. JC732]|uniref:Pseudouridine synthase n=1 Tax=Blastopirellula sediminis TaxID=2894196 RepID=A0A9X1MK23_9BACT|nr:RluA family pseudouridine synthase [Blastopirellula sediminis]MCC9609032.1 RluA family pseudouridine synthase [Blastopirellula sediminis]MCC9628191.1 RluA family pseudouridine synthase [Blastopirellula sediminis]
MPDSDSPLHEIVITAEQAGGRVDHYLASQFEGAGVSRGQIRKAMDAGRVTIDGIACKPAHKLSVGERLVYPTIEPRSDEQVGSKVALDILFQDDRIAVINKPAGMITHPAKGQWKGTLTEALRGNFAQLSSSGGPTRPGIVHRLDRDTSGVILIAKDDEAHEFLKKQFQDRSTEKEYFAIVIGVPDRDRDMINEPIGPHPRIRERMAIRRGDDEGKEAQTFYEVLERYNGFAAIKALPKTGRTHQIRVHLAHAGHAVLCDPLYGGRRVLTLGELKHNDDPTVLLGRTALHARRLAIAHPDDGQVREFIAPLPQDILQTQAKLQELRPAR